MKKEPIVRLGDRHKKFRIQFWEYFRPSFLNALKEAIEAGAFGQIDRFEGKGLTDEGETLAYSWNGGEVEYRPTAALKGTAGYVVFHGKLDYWNINLLRNFPMFHMRKWLRLAP